MKYRRFGRTDWHVGEIAYGMWGLAEWQGTDMREVESALDHSLELGCNFYDTAAAYGNGKSELILSALLSRHKDKEILYATKIPPMNLKWPSKPHYALRDVFPKRHIIEYTERSLKHLNVECIPLQQFHVWEDNWANIDEWKEAIEILSAQGKVQHWGISINRWEPHNVLNTLRTGLIDAVQVIYNIFDQNPEDELFALCRDLDIGVIARVPFDEGTLTGTMTEDTVFPADDWRASYFVPENLIPSVRRANALKTLVPKGMNLPELALRFILECEDVHTIIPGMRRLAHVRSNMLTSDGHRLDKGILTELKKHRWVRTPTEWSQ